MRDPAALHGASTGPVPIRVGTAAGGSVLRLKSWRDGAIAPMIDGGQWPAQVGHTLGGPLRVLCVAPGDWLILCDTLPSSALRQQLHAGLRDGHVLVDLGDAYVRLEVAGSCARDLLSKGCGLDLHPHTFPAGRCARTRFAQIPVVIECLDDSPRFELLAARSYAQYLHAWLVDAAAEFRDARWT